MTLVTFNKIKWKSLGVVYTLKGRTEHFCAKHKGAALGKVEISRYPFPKYTEYVFSCSKEFFRTDKANEFIAKINDYERN